MCLGVPHQVLAVNESLQQLTVLAWGEKRTVSAMLLDQSVTVDDYVLLQVGDFACDVLSKSQAQESLALLEKLEFTRHDHR
jgi:hydrogenase assembly chaperone HypC/HupF